MKSRLSALKFVKNNKKQVYVMILAIALTFMTMYVVGFLLGTTTVSFNKIFLEAPKKTAYINLTAETMGVDRDKYATDEELNEAMENARNEVIKKLEGHEGIDHVYFTQVLRANYSAVMGGVGYEFPLLEKDQIQGYMDHVGATLIEGKMPENDGDILVDKYVAYNNRVKVGDYYREDIFGETFKVCGIISSDTMNLVGIPNGYSNTGWYFVVECNEDNCDMKKVCEDIGYETTAFDQLFDISSWTESYKKDVSDVIDAATLGIIIVVTIFLAISIIVAYVAFMRNRVNEYCLYTSIGYGKKDIYQMIMRELIIIFGSSLIIGFIISIAVMILFNHLLITPLGLVCKYIYPKLMLSICSALAAIIGIIQIPVVIIINSIKTIDMIED